MATMIETSTFWHQILDKGVQSLVKSLSDQEIIEMTEHYGTHNYHPAMVNVRAGQGVEVWDGNGKRYLDCIGVYSAMAHGHRNEAILNAVREQLDVLTVASRAVYTSEVALFLKGLAEYCHLDMVCPMNSGAEANETCIKLARKWAYTVKGVPDDQAEIIVCQDNFHGRTTTIIGFSTEKQYRDKFGPYGPGFKVIPFNDLEALEAAITPNTAAFFAEPIQAEGGIIIPEPGYMEKVRKLCTEKNVLLIWDEVQTGFCRTGKRMGWEHEDAKPDLLAVGKPLGGGIMPVSAAVGRKEVMDVFEFGDHGSIFDGNPLGAVVALTAMAQMEVEDFAGQAERKGSRMMKQIADLNLPEVKELRGRGLLLGIEVHEGVDAKKLGHLFLENGIITKQTRHRTFRMTPPIVITDSQIDEAVDKIKQTFSQL